MKKLLLTTVCLLLSLVLSAQEEDEFTRYAGLDSLLTKFYSALEREENEVKNSEFDSLIEMCGDSLTRQHVTMEVFDHYSHSRVMGEEAVAIHVYDKWIASGLVKTRSEFETMEKEMFATFNRNSLVGMKAPEIVLRKPCGKKVKVPEPGKISIFFFYATDCKKCQLEKVLLPQALESIDIPVNLYAVVFGTDRKEWRAYRKGFKVSNPNVRVVHLWDPEVDSDYQRLYGVTGTPKIFVILDDGEIIGRRLELDNIPEIFDYLSITYGSKEK